MTDSDLSSGLVEGPSSPLVSSGEDVSEVSNSEGVEIAPVSVSSESFIESDLSAAPDASAAAAEKDPLEGGILGPCAETGDPICHCGEPEAHADPDCVEHVDGHVAEHSAAEHSSLEHGDGSHEAVAHSSGGHSGHGAGHNPHDPDSPLHGEHMAVFDLVKHADATHVAIKDGAWSDPGTWAGGSVPGNGARVLIQEGVHVEYDVVSDARLFTVRVDGHLDFETRSDTKMVVDTMVVDGVGRLTIGTEADPIAEDVTADIVIANNGAINVSWDPELLSRGIVSHGAVEIHGQEKTTHLKVATDPMAGDTSILLEELPEGWQIGDTLVLAGTHYDGYKWDHAIGRARHFEPEDEVLTITAIQGNEIFFDTALQYDHDSPRADLKTSVANYSRNVTIQTENPETAAVHERGHVMFMHNDDIDVRYASFHELGRTDKSQDLDDGGWSAANVAGRYSFHLHRAGVGPEEDPATAVGNAVFGSPGWGFVHHDSHAVLHDNATYNTFGAGFVSETGNETGTWSNNIAIYAQGRAWSHVKLLQDTSGTNFDTGRSGDGFWFQSRMIEAFDNVAASVNHGYAYFHRGDVHTGEAQLRFDASAFDLPEALGLADDNTPDDAPILHFRGNEVFAAREGLHVVKAGPIQEHDVRTNLQDFTAWSVHNGAHIEYTAHYTFNNFDLIARDDRAETGISIGNNSSDITIIDSTIDGFRDGITASKFFTGFFYDFFGDVSDTKFIVVNTDLTNISSTSLNNIDQVLSASDIVPGRFDIQIDGPLTYRDGNGPTDRRVVITGTKTDSLGTISIPTATDIYDASFNEVIAILEQNGWYQGSDGKKYFVLEDYYSDRVTGEIFKTAHLVEINANVNLGTGFYANAVFAGNLDLNSLDPVTQGEALEIQAGSNVVIDLLANDTDPDGDPLRIDGIAQPANGQVFDNGDGTVTYRPDFDFTGTDSFKYWVTDDQGNYTQAVVNIEVSPDGSSAPTPFSFNGSNYYIGTSGLSWHDAQAEAEAFGGKLLEINSQAENDFVVQTFGGSAPIWLGFSDAQQEGTWVGADDKSVSFTNWLPGEPNNYGNQDFAIIASFDGRWDDIDANGGWFFDAAVGWNNENANLTIIEVPQTVSFSGSTYELGTAGRSWSEAKAEAEARGGKLLEINSQAENDFILQMFGGAAPIWLGFSDAQQEGSWVAADDTSVSFTNWLPGEPNNYGNQDYAVIASSDGRWDDINQNGGWFFNTETGWSNGHATLAIIEFDSSTAAAAQAEENEAILTSADTFLF